jgi:hypothetical protein
MDCHEDRVDGKLAPESRHIFHNPIKVSVLGIRRSPPTLPSSFYDSGRPNLGILLPKKRDRVTIQMSNRMSMF